ncbi:MAG TPA: EAL domain-containing protein, partial [Beijerinckiaceae bacterium]
RPARAHGLLRVLRDTERPAHAEPGRLADLAARLDDLLAPGAEPPEPFALVALARVDADARPLDDAPALRTAAARIAERMRRSDRIALLDDARLLLLLEGCADDEPATAFARFARAAEPVAPHGLRGGVVFGPRPAYDARDLIAEARAALDRACAGGPALVSAPRLRATGRDAEDQRVCDAARTALQEGGLSLALQPVVRAGDRQLAFNECLMRLRGPDGAPLSPMELMPAAERTGLVLQIDHAVLDRSLSLLEADGRRTLSVNVSGPTLHHPMWTRRLDAALAGRERCASRLIIEITETSALENLEATGRALAHLRGLGVRIAMDDFGAGHTSFRNLRALAFDLVKIDGAYVQDLLASPDDQVFVRTLNDLARHLGAATVAEWVQDLEAARLLESWGVGYLQGAAFGLAQDVADAARDAA